MRRWMAASLGLAFAVGLTSVESNRATAQPKGGPVAESFRTPDGVELNSLFHAANPAAAQNPGNAPVVVFLYPPGPDRDLTKGDWAGLAKMLNNAGYHVFQFDWRGHGKSTNIKDKEKFWGNIYLNAPGPPLNSLIRGRPPKRPIKNDINYKDLTQPERYMPAYLLDLAGVRVHLDTKNDNKELNTSSIYIVGAGDAAGLGLAWMASEWKRPHTMPNVQLLGLGATGYEYVPQALRGNFDEAGVDFGGAVWLTGTKPTTFNERAVKAWVSNGAFAPKMRENNPMLFLYADKDVNGRRQSEFFYNEVLVAEPRKGVMLDKLDQTFIKEVKGGAQLQGVKLLGQNATLKTEDTILQYFAAIQKARAKIPSKARKYDTPYFIDLRYFGLVP